MKKIFNLLFIFSFCIVFGQSKQFLYEYKSMPDSTKKGVPQVEIMALNFNKDKSEYFSLEKFVADSTIQSEIKDGSYYLKPPAPPQKRGRNISDIRVLKLSNSNEIKFVTRISDAYYLVSQNINLKWKLYPEYITILNYKAQKATTEFGGRKWTAWFAKDIPFQDGPYKFRGLPGLIVKIEDETKSHQFELKGIKNLKNSFNYPDNSDESKIEIQYLKYVKAFKDHRKFPAIELKKRFPKAEDAEWVNSTEKYMLEDLKKDNNIIEIDLLKK